jgi:hypothetical protein
LPALAERLDPDSSLLADARLGLGQLRVRQRRFAEGEALLAESLAGIRAALGDGHHRVGWTRLWLGRALAGQGRTAAAVAEWRSARTVLRPGRDDGFLAAVDEELGRAGATP